MVRPRALIGCASALLCLLLSVAAASATRVWIDTDPAIGSPFREVDDGFALILALHSPELQIAGISTTYGNASLAVTTRVARDLVQRFASPPPLVVSGARSRADLGQPTAATEALRRALEDGGSLTYVALGPLTNLATFQRLHPRLARGIERVVFVGGRSPTATLRFGAGGWLHIHDANVVKDPSAVASVLASGLPCALVPIETSAHFLLDRDDLQSLRRGDPAGVFLFRHSRVWHWFWHSVLREGGGPLFDAPAVALAADPFALSTDRRFAHIAGEELIVAPRAAPGGRPVTFCTAVPAVAQKTMRRRLARKLPKSLVGD
ncbi:MAG: nucleoside hydrolase [Chthoniobacterales bacterium]